MHTMCSREIFTKKCRQQQIFDSDLKGAWHYNHVTFTPIAKNVMLYCRLIYMLSILCVRLTTKVKVGIPESFKVGWYPPKKTGSSHLKEQLNTRARPEEIISTVPDLTSRTQDSSTATTAFTTPLNPFNVTPELTQAAISQKPDKESQICQTAEETSA